MSTGKTSPDRSSCSGWKKNYSEPKCYWKLIILNGIFVSRTWFENNKSVRCQLIQLTFSNALKPVAKRIWTSDPSLRRAPTYCHSLSIWGKVNPSGILYKTVSDSIRVILNTPSVKLCKALKVSWLFAPANNWGMPWYYHRHLLYDHHASYVRSW